MMNDDWQVQTGNSAWRSTFRLIKFTLQICDMWIDFLGRSNNIADHTGDQSNQLNRICEQILPVGDAIVYHLPLGVISGIWVPGWYWDHDSHYELAATRSWLVGRCSVSNNRFHSYGWLVVNFCPKALLTVINVETRIILLDEPSSTIISHHWPSSAIMNSS